MLIKKVSFILLVAWLIVIFIFSNMNGFTSYSLSEGILMDISNNAIVDKATFDLNHLILRKTAHVFEYFILSALAYNYLRFYIYNNRKILYIVVFLFVITCSSIDEIHQLLVVERLGKIEDVLIDSIGVIVFLIIVIISKKYVATRKSN